MFNQFAITQASVVGPLFIATATVIVVSPLPHVVYYTCTLYAYMYVLCVCMLLSLVSMTLCTTYYMQFYYIVTLFYIKKIYAMHGELTCT